MTRPQLTADDLEAMRHRLTALALDITIREGAEALTFRRLAELAGISHTLPYRYFDNKEALVVAIRVECTQHFERFVREREQRCTQPLEKIRALAEAYVEYVKTFPGEYQMIFAMHSPAPDAYTDLLAARRSLFDHAVDVVQDAIDSGHLRGDARAIAHLFWVSLHGLMTLHVAGQLVHGMDLDALAQPLVEQILSGAQASDLKKKKIR
ncbi:TetR/AcrR family transcriptional regulator [Sinimarinibacterium sp. CAU 1509]|uniref:TetR/AcrR family transcriptional regulator n=1 Tax=Sinimarinibacterium sp. CAU 1509 TaxID=2562283 RepID=UPI0010AC73D6|nr:TetR/AcrR family transcriptional regulator [Sinimarinibacterium sp. CAU 1509]TJY59517.1 TetR/AcrR family transcriptional regulator [Sinimarinibacterium sp. CAU 1509]